MLLQTKTLEDTNIWTLRILMMMTMTMISILNKPCLQCRVNTDEGIAYILVGHMVLQYYTMPLTAGIYTYIHYRRHH